MAPSIVWLRRDLRLADQAAFAAAAAAGAVIPAYILDDETPQHRRMGGAQRWWLHHSLASLERDLQQCGSRLILRRGPAAAALASLVAETGADCVHALRHPEPWWRNAERALAKSVELVLHDGNYLMPPGSVRSGSGDLYKIYTPFWRALGQHMPPAFPAPAPDRLAAPEVWPAGDHLEDWKLLPVRPNWATGFDIWTPGEAGARQRLGAFVEKATSYADTRNLPAVDGTSRLSPHLHFGELSPASVWHAVAPRGHETETFLKELVWRDYAANIVLARPEYGRCNGKPQFDALPWRDLAKSSVRADLVAWRKGLTGYPIVDAGMRELWTTGWMHNRVRMIAASFLVKHLLIDWREGERWFWDTLVDADYGSNSVNWQWTAGTGVDANMFVRIMAPLSQSEKFDAAGYIRRWVPELAHLDAPAIHDPDEFGQRPSGYPAKIVGHRAGRERALAAFAAIKSCG
jgi:deoxyribodipyrimidine photo-lyase